MTKRLIVLDFETKDPYIGRKLGAGWVFANNVESHDFKVLGCAVRLHTGRKQYLDLTDETGIVWLFGYIQGHEEILAHNATYELGILHYLEQLYPFYKGKATTKPIHDTKLLYKLVNNTLQSYSLDALCKKYLTEPKGHKTLIDAVIKHDLMPWKAGELSAKLKAEKKGEEYIRAPKKDKDVLKWAYENMDVIQDVDFEAMSDYAISDADLTYQLYEKAIPQISPHLVDIYSKITKIVVKYRLKGVRLDLKTAHRLSDELTPKIKEKEQAIFALAGEEFNVNSCKDMPRIFDKLKIKYPFGDKGNPSITTPWMKKQKHEICKLIVELRNEKKLQSDFLGKLIEMQQYTCPGATDYGIVYPELNVLEAVTGRFSSTNPNIQQQSKEGGIRDLFLPFEGDKWYSLDFSNQEGRLQIHYAKLMNLEGVDFFVEAFKKNPDYDIHKKVASLMFDMKEQDVTKDIRTIAKTINLGTSYSMGTEKLAVALGVPKERAKKLRERYNLYFPFLDKLNRHAMKTLKERGFIKTLAGRYSYKDQDAFVDGELKSFEYKALNKLIQGAALDQIVTAMIWADEENIPILFPVHDELCMSGTLEQAKRLKYIMEHCIDLVIPSYTEIKCGDTWGSVKELEGGASLQQ